MNLKIPRNYADALCNLFFPLFEKIKVANFNNVRHMQHVSGEYQTVRVINSLLDEVQYRINRKLFVTKGANVSIDLNDAEAVALMRMLMQTPVAATEVYGLLVRAKIIEQLDGQLQSSILSDKRYQI